MRPLLIFALLLSSIIFIACHKGPKGPVNSNTDGMGGSRNWHVYYHSNVHRYISPDSVQTLDTTYQIADKTFALDIMDNDTVVFNNTKYFFASTNGSKRFFPIWHTQLSGNQGKITYNTDSNSIQIYVDNPGVSAENEYWYYSY